jgi:nitrite reductase/ring-hydroxylating ferredoxin subunit
MTRAIDVGALEDFADGTHTVVEARGQEIAVIRWGVDLYAVRTRCPHQAAPLCGAVLPSLDSAGPGTMAVDRSAPVVQCSWHRWEFDLGTGRARCDPSVRVKTFAVHSQNGRVILDV